MIGCLLRELGPMTFLSGWRDVPAVEEGMVINMPTFPWL